MRLSSAHSAFRAKAPTCPRRLPLEAVISHSAGPAPAPCDSPARGEARPAEAKTRSPDPGPLQVTARGAAQRGTEPALPEDTAQAQASLDSLRPQPAHPNTCSELQTLIVAHAEPGPGCSRPREAPGPGCSAPRGAGRVDAVCGAFREWAGRDWASAHHESSGTTAARKGLAVAVPAAGTDYVAGRRGRGSFLLVRWSKFSQSSFQPRRFPLLGRIRNSVSHQPDKSLRGVGGREGGSSRCGTAL